MLAYALVRRNEFCFGSGVDFTAVEGLIVFESVG
jgi:hypothetical protein